MRAKEFISERMTAFEVDQIEKWADTLWKDVGIDVTLRNPHFIERIYRPEHDRQPIEQKELWRLLRKEHDEYSKQIASTPVGKTAVLTDKLTNINTPITMHPIRGSKNKEMAPDTIMRKPVFHIKPGERKYVVR